MQQKNLFVFALLSVLLIAAWYWFIVYPEQGKTTDPDKKELAKFEAKKKVVEKPKDDEKKQTEKIDEKKPPEVKKQDPDKKPPAKDEPAQTVSLGGEGFYLSVDVTSRGAGVRKVTLNQFKAADWRGRPTDEPLQLIQDDEYCPSFRMYPYPHPKDANPVPVLGLGEKNWEFLPKTVKKDGSQEASFWTTVPEMPNVKIVKTYRLEAKTYHVTMLLEFHDTRSDPKAKAIDFRYQLTGGQGVPIEGEWYTSIFRNSFIGLVDSRGSLWRKQEESTRISGHKGGDRIPEVTRADNRLIYAGSANQYFAVMIVVDEEQPTKAEGGVPAADILAWARPTLETTEKKGFIRTIDLKKDSILFVDENGKPETFILLPRTKKHIQDLELAVGDKITLSFYETPEGKKVATWLRLGASLRPQFDDITVRVNSESFQISPGEPVKHQFMLYHGPVKAALLGQFTGEKEVSDELVERYTHTLHLRTLTDYPSDNWFGLISSKIYLTDLIIQFTRLMHWLLNILQSIVGSYGISVIILTVMVRGAMFPISRKQAMFSIKMQELGPELKKIQDKYPNDPQAKMQATQEFYRKHGINPLGSCWPVFLQMPIFLGLYFALQESIHFRLAEFLWMSNLAAPDMLIPWTESIPFISNPDSLGSMLYLGPYLNVLPVIAVIFMMVQQMQTMPPPTDDQQAMQQKMLKYMTIFFGIMFYKVAAGLCIYFIASSLWGMAERKLLPKKKTVPLDVPSAGSTSSTAITSTPGYLAPKGKNKWAKKDKEKEKEPVTPFEKLKALWRQILKEAEKK